MLMMEVVELYLTSAIKNFVEESLSSLSEFC